MPKTTPLKTAVSATPQGEPKQQPEAPGQPSVGDQKYQTWLYTAWSTSPVNLPFQTWYNQFREELLAVYIGQEKQQKEDIPF